MAKDKDMAAELQAAQVRLDLIRTAEKEVTEADARVAAATVKVENAKALLKHEEAAREDAVASLRAVVTGKPTQMDLPLEPTKAPGKAAKADKPAAESSADAWRGVSVHTLGLPEKLALKLIDADLPTVGAIAAWSAAGKRLTDIAGVGEANAQKIEDALIKFWAAHPEWCRPQSTILSVRCVSCDNHLQVSEEGVAQSGWTRFTRYLQKVEGFDAAAMCPACDPDKRKPAPKQLTHDATGVASAATPEPTATPEPPKEAPPTPPESVAPVEPDEPDAGGSGKLNAQLGEDPVGQLESAAAATPQAPPIATAAPQAEEYSGPEVVNADGKIVVPEPGIKYEVRHASRGALNGLIRKVVGEWIEVEVLDDMHPKARKGDVRNLRLGMLSFKRLEQ